MTEPETTEHILWRVVDDEALIINLETGNYYSLNPVATAILISLCRGNTPTNLATQVSLTYQIPFETIWEDIVAFMAELQTEALVNLDTLEEFNVHFSAETGYEKPVVRKYDQIDCIAAYSPD